MNNDEAQTHQQIEAKVDERAGGSPLPHMKIHWSLIVMVLAVFVSGCGGLLSRAAAVGVESVGNAVWVLGLLLILPMLVALGVFHILGRSNRTANMAFAVTTLVTIVPQSITAILLSSHNSSSAKSVVAEMAQIAKEVQSTDVDSSKIEQLGNRSVAALEKFKDGLSGTSRSITGYLQKQTEQTFKLQADYMRAMEEFSAAGGLAKIDQSSVDDVNGKLTLIDSATLKHDALLSHLSTIGNRLNDEMTRVGCSPAEKQAILTGVDRPVPLEMAIQLTVLEHQLLAPVRRKLEILRDSFGYWEIGEDGVMVVAEGFPMEKLADYNEAAAEFGRLAQEQAELREKIAALQPKQ